MKGAKDKPSKKRNPRSEAAQREAMRKRASLQWYIWRVADFMAKPEVHAYENGQHLAIFDLRDCYRKRAPLKGITKAMRKAVQPKRKVKRTKRTK